MCVYIAIGFLVGDFVSPLSIPNSQLLFVLAQCDGPLPIYPWTLVTSIFLHASIIHIASNILFLLFFGFILEEQVTKSRWVATFFITGLVGSLGFVGYDVLGYLLSGGTPT